MCLLNNVVTLSFVGRWGCHDRKEGSTINASAVKRGFEEIGEGKVLFTYQTHHTHTSHILERAPSLKMSSVIEGSLSYNMS